MRPEPQSTTRRPERLSDEPATSRAILQVRSGPLAYHKAILEPGSLLRVGRTSRADLVLSHDAQLSGVHFTLTWDGARCRLCDAGSITGTMCGGRRIAEEVDVQSGAWIRAGDTDFMLYVEGATPPRRPARRAAPGLDEPAAALVCEALEGAGARLFAVLDAARDVRILELLQESVDDFRPLYEGIQGEALASFAPYLVELGRGSRLLAALVREGWGRRWGIYLTSGRPFKAVRTHLRRFLVVLDDETGGRRYFRYYDPVVLRRFVPTCNRRQLDHLFDGVATFLVEGRDREVVRFERDERDEAR